MSAVLTQVLYIEAPTIQDLQARTNETIARLEEEGYGIKSHSFYVSHDVGQYIACIVYGKGPTIMHQTHR